MNRSERFFNSVKNKKTAVIGSWRFKYRFNKIIFEKRY